MDELLPVLLLSVVAVVFAAGSIVVSNLSGPRRPKPTKFDAYESTNEPLADVPGTRFLATSPLGHVRLRDRPGGSNLSQGTPPPPARRSRVRR